jgi:hypothetical protein
VFIGRTIGVKMDIIFIDTWFNIGILYGEIEEESIHGEIRMGVHNFGK